MLTEVSCQRRGALRAAHESKDVHGLDALLKGWKYPTSYAEYEDYYSKHRDLEEGFKADLAEMRAAHESSDVQKLLAKLRAWQYPKTYAEYAQYVEEHEKLSAGAGILAALDFMRAAHDSHDVRALELKLHGWEYSTDDAGYKEYLEKHGKLAADFEADLQETEMARTTASPPKTKRWMNF